MSKHRKQLTLRSQVFLLVCLAAWGCTQDSDFKLHSISGEVAWSKFRGRGAIVYFGFTACPDVCPVSLQHLKTALDAIPAQERGQLLPIFVSVDDRSDTPDKADRYMKSFIPQGVGLAGSAAEIHAAIGHFNSTYKIRDNKNPPVGYTIKHGTDFYFVDSQGKTVVALPAQASQNELIAGLRAILR